MRLVSIIEQIGVVAVALGALISLWKMLRGSKEEVSLQLEALWGATVLLADDSVTIQKVVELTCMDASVHLTCVSDGVAATDLLEQQQFDIVIADVHMPGKSGYEVCEHAKRLNPEVPVLLFVGAFEPFSEDLYRGCGADQVLKKPFDSTDLLMITNRLLRQREERQDVEKKATH